MFDVSAVTARAEQALAKNLNNPEESRQLFLEEIMDWSENYSENYASRAESPEAKIALVSIVSLWSAYANMESNLKQFKKAVQIFDDSLNDPIVSKAADIYIAYGIYCQGRGKLSNAQKVYIKGLTAHLHQGEADKIWVEFLKLIKSSGQPDLTVDQLYEAVRLEAGVDTITKPGSGAGGAASEAAAAALSATATTAHIESEDVNPDPSCSAEIPMDISDGSSLVHAESKTNDDNEEGGSSGGGMGSTDTTTINNNDGSSGVVEVSGSSSDDVAMNIDALLDEVKREQSSVGTPTSTTIATATATSIEQKPRVFVGGDDLDSVVGITPEVLVRMHTRRPPMLFTAPSQEPTCRGLNALSPDDRHDLEALFDMPLVDLQDCATHTPDSAAPTNTDHAERCLDIIEGLWTVQALKERHFEVWFLELRKLHDAENAKLRAEFQKRERDLVTAATAKTKNEAELKRFQNRCTVHLEMVHAIVNKTLFSMLLEQLRSLSLIGFPRATTELIERLENSLESRRSGGVTQGAEYDPTLVKDILSVKTLACATLSLRVNLFTPAVGGLPLKRPGGSFGVTNEFDDYYSLEAKKHRKAKRRRFSDAVPGIGGDFNHHSINHGSKGAVTAATDATTMPLSDPQQLLNKLANIIKQVKNA